MVKRRFIKRRRRKRTVTKITLMGTRVVGGDKLEVILKNEGNAALSDFHLWDVVVEYRGSRSAGYASITKRLFYTLAFEPGGNQWTARGLHSDISGKEVLMPDEEMVIRMKLGPEMEDRIYHRVIIVAPDNTSVAATFIRH